MRYLVRLKPLGEFFFGSEQTFSKDDLRDSSSFFAKSFMFPQPHSIFGMLRAEILRAKKKMKIHINGEWVGLPKRKNNNENTQAYKEVVKLVGNESFDFEKEINMGIIKEIGEVFLLKGNDVYYKAPNDYDLSPKKTDIKVSFNGRKRKFINFGIKPKEFYNDKFLYKNGVVSESEIFEKVVSVGIKKDSEQEGFFQREGYKLKDDFEFGFFVELDEDVKLENIVKIGGDRSYFKLSMNKVENLNINYPEFKQKEGFTRFILLSEAYVNSEIENFCDYVLGESEIFRSIQSKRYNFKKSKRVKVLKRGTVLYAKDAEKIEKFLKNHLYKLGYNRFKRS